MPNTALGRSNVAILTNKSGGALVMGDTVVIDTGTATSFTTTTTSGYASGVLGVIIEPNGIANNATGLVAFDGYVAKVNLSGSASLGDLFKSHTVAGQSVRHAAPMVTGDFGIVLGTGTTPAALLFGKPHVATAAGLTNSNISPTTANVTAAVNTRYFANVSGLTAARNFVVPAGTIGDQIELHITTGDDTYALVIIGDTGISINGGSTATEWSRLFITNEVVTLVANSTTNWQVAYDGRIPCKGQLALSASDTTNSAGALTTPTWDTAVINVGEMCDLTNFRFNVRRAGYYTASGSAQPNGSMTDQHYYAAQIQKGGVAFSHSIDRSSGATTCATLAAKSVLCAVGDAILMQYQPQAANMGIYGTDTTVSWFQLREELRGA